MWERERPLDGRTAPPPALVRATRALWTLARRRPMAAASGGLLATMVVVALFAELVATHDPLAHNIPGRLRPPGSDSYFGTDGFGRDVFSGVVYGVRTSLLVAGLSLAGATVVGTLIGAGTAYRGGKTDLIVQRLVDIVLGFPFLVLAVMVIAAFGASITTVIVAITTAFVPQVVRFSRGSALAVRSEGYVDAARGLGATPSRILLRHILPNIAPHQMAYGTSLFGTALLAEAALSFLGLGVPPPASSWGRMIQEGAEQFLEVAPWLTLFPGAALSLLVLSAAFLGDALRDLLDPRLRFEAEPGLRG